MATKQTKKLSPELVEAAAKLTPTQLAKLRKQLAAKQAATPAVVVATPVVKPLATQHGYVETLVDSVLAQLVASGQRLNIASIATSRGGASSTPGKLAETIATKLSEMATISGHSEMAIPAARIGGDLWYLANGKASGSAFAADGSTAKPRNPRSSAAAVATSHVADAVAKLAGKRKPRGKRSAS